MAFAAGGGGVPSGGAAGPPPSSVASSFTNSSSATPFGASAANLTQQLQEALLQQQQSSTSQIMLQQLLASALLGGSANQSPLSLLANAAVAQPSNIQSLLGGGAGSSGAVASTASSAAYLASLIQPQPAVSQMTQLGLLTQPTNTLNSLLPLLNLNQLMSPQQNAIASLLNPMLLLQQQQQQQLALLSSLQQAQTQPSVSLPVPTPTTTASQPSSSTMSMIDSHTSSHHKLMEAMAQDTHNVFASREKERVERVGPVAPPPATTVPTLAPSAVAAVTHHPPLSSSLSSNDLTLDPESVKDRISRLISENEAIVEPNPVLLKRRPYHRQTVATASGESEHSVVRDPRAPTTRSQSLYEPLRGVSAFGGGGSTSGSTSGGSITSGQPLIRGNDASRGLTCAFCQLRFANEPSLQVHEQRCSRRAELKPAELAAIEAARNPLKRKILEMSNGEVPKQPKIETPDIAIPPPNLEVRRGSRGSIQTPHRPAPIQPQPTPSTMQPPSTVPMHISTLPQTIQAPPPEPFAASSIASSSNHPSLPRRATIAAIPCETKASVKKELPNPALVLSDSQKDLGSLNKPYTLVLQAQKEQTELEKLADKRRNVTSETFVCINRPQPMYAEHKGNISMYSNYHQVPVNEAESKLNLLFMGQCSTRPRVGHKPFWRFTVASRDLGQLRMTHSSFWELSTKMRLRQTQVNQLLQSVQPQPLDLPLNISSDAKLLSLDMNIREFLSLHGTAQNAVNAMAAALKESTEKPDVSSTAAPNVSNPEPTQEVKRSEGTAIPTKSERQSPLEQTKASVKLLPPALITTHPNKISNKTTRGDQVLGGYRTEEVYVYVRGRGRGRYVCERCGIRCKKPSMLKKHIKSHTDVRPYKCGQCNFSFKTKGNLTKHISSKAHRRRLGELAGHIMPANDSDDDSDAEDRLEIASPEPVEDMAILPDDDEGSSDNEDDHFPERDDVNYKKYGQENILIERSTHTPPSVWLREDSPTRELTAWRLEQRQCSSAPPASLSTPPTSRRIRNASSSQARRDEQASTSSASSSNSSLPNNTVNNINLAKLDKNMTLGALASSSIQSGGNNVPLSTIFGSYLSKDQEYSCNQCDRIFRKQSDLTLHQHTHNIERSKVRNFQCNECSLVLRSRSLLLRHLELFHAGTQRSLESDTDIGGLPTQTVLGNPLANNPRSFVCTDCNIGFRKHGILAKHLRSKTHVMKLESLGKLPEDSLSLITKRDNGNCLNDVDTTDCERARISLLSIVHGLRDSSGNISVDDDEAPMPAPKRSIVSGMPGPMSMIGVKQPRLDSPPTDGMPKTPPMLLSSPSPSMLRPDSEPVIARPIASMNYRPRGESFSVHTMSMPFETMASRRRCDSVSLHHGKDSISANIWVPPKAESIMPERPKVPDSHWPKSSSLNDSAHENGCRSDENTSESGGRSSASTPVHKLSNGHTPSPLQVPARCSFCDQLCEGPIELQVHVFTDHVTLKEGKDFRCPKKYCDKVYPNKDCLRNHINAHFQRGGATPTPGHSESDALADSAVPSAAATPSDDSAGHRLLTQTISNAPSAPNHSPGAPEGASIGNRTSPASSVTSTCESPGSVEAVLRLPSDDEARAKALLEKMLDNPSFQKHLLSQVVPRPHVCEVCDAGFTTAEALMRHSICHKNEIAVANGTGPDSAN